jgi:HD-GYP domain-containing protein (c-di-GMP phosphodiesterase class II)
MLSTFQYSDLVFGIAKTIDLISPHIANHHRLVAYISYCLGTQLGLSPHEQMELEIAGSLHDIGGLTLSERLAPLEFEYKNSNLHAEKGYLLLNTFKPFSNIAQFIRYHHNSWLDGACVGIDKQEIPFESHILNLADRIAVLIDVKNENILSLVDYVLIQIEKRKDNVFHPKIVDAFIQVAKKDCFWLEMQYLKTPNYISKKKHSDFLIIEPHDAENFMIMLSHIIDYKSRFTAAHSSTVAACAEIIAQYAGFNQAELKMIKYAGYIHDLGKLAIPTEILEKPGALSKEEFAKMRAHTYHTNRVLSEVSAFDKIRIWGALHHEKLNGKGYPFGLNDKDIPLGSRIMTVADIFTAIREKRPYRDPMSKEKTINVLEHMADSYEIDKRIVEIVKNNFKEIDIVREKTHQNSINEFNRFTNEYEKHAKFRI